jgi:hypothetical protein
MEIYVAGPLSTESHRGWGHRAYLLKGVLDSVK